MKIGTIEHLKALEAAATSGPWVATKYIGKTGFVEPIFIGSEGQNLMKDAALIAAMRNSIKRLLAVVENHKALVDYCSDRFTWSAPNPDEWEYMTDSIYLDDAKRALSSLEEVK